MFKSVKNNKGFTLIELLAVIVIMGVLMMVALPQVTRYIENSKKDAYAETAKSYINAVRYALLNDELSNGLPDTNEETVTIKLSEVTVESGGENSPYSRTIDKDHSCVKVTNTTTADTNNSKKNDDVTYEYKIYIRDVESNGTKDFIEENKLKRGNFTRKLATDTDKCG